MTATVVTDPAGLVAFVDAVGERSIGLEAASRLITDPSSVVIGGRCGGTPAGYLIGYSVTRIDGALMLIIYDVGVAPEHRRRGVGSAMVESALEHARSVGATKAWVLTERDNEPAVALYRSRGAVTSGTDDLVMWWQLD